MADATFEIKREGQTFEVTVPEGEDPNTALAQFMGDTAPEETDRGFMRGLGRGTRAVVGAVPKLVGGLGDIVAAGLNIPIAGIERFGEATAERGLKRPVDIDLPRFPTNRVETIEQLLTDMGFPESETTGERIQSFMAEFAVPGMGAAGAITRGVAKVPGAVQKVPGIARGLGEEIAEFFTKTPGRAIAAETGGAGGAATGRVLAEEEEIGPLGQFFAELAGGVAGGIAPTAAVNLSRRAATRGLETIAPFTEAGGTRRAARALQEATDDPAAAALAAREAPEGVSPATATEDPRLQALEGRARVDDPAVEARITGGLAQAEKRNLDELADLAKGTDPGDWQHRVVQSVAPEGVVIAKGQTDEMFADAGRAFGTAYDGARGHDIQARLTRTIADEIAPPTAVSRAVNDPNVLVGDEVRTRVGRWLTNRFKDVAQKGRRVLGGPADAPVHEVTSDDLLTLRSDIRNEARRRSKSASTDTQAEGELLNNAAREITNVLEDQLPQDAVNILRATDSQYRQFKTAENASVRGAQGLTAGSLRQAIRSRESQGRVARGETGPLGALAEQGADIKTILSKKDVQGAQRIVRTMTPEQRATTKSDFTRELVRRAEGKIAGETRLKGARLLDEVEQNRAVLKAAGLETDDFARIERIGKELKMIQGRSAAKVQELLTDNVGTVMRLLGAIGGSRAGTRLLRVFGGAGGAGPSLILAQFGSRELRKTLSKLSVDRGDAIMRAAFEDADLFAALLTAPTDSIKQQATAAKVINAWLVSAGAETAAPTKEE